MKNNLLFTVLWIFFCSFFLLSCTHQISKDNIMVPEGEQYKLGSEDVVEVLIWKEEDLSRVVTIKPDGRISLPLLGEIQAAGLTSDELNEKIGKKLEKYLDNPTVSVIVREINSFKVYIQGEVVQPGVYQLKSNTTIVQAISLAGGFTEWAKKNKMTILRKVKGKQIRIPVNYSKIVSGKDISQNFLLKREDIVIVP